MYTKPCREALVFSGRTKHIAYRRGMGRVDPSLPGPLPLFRDIKSTKSSPDSINNRDYCRV
ncbi:hypothetical protein ASPCADRAFT_207774 [Aspergillus carbonarius ITEM 5010]|uniref:Uncharacterized protein n=1 Tax=Aspergillus carbonarius (strain ITEM 5010) TaxID=602072 RepID=A0A1R3RLC6_ASPC5|nr:hypothetical protein ASPCADRAFT_207774 [Aspergillus carbonarius ITEM 5010]